MANPLFQKFLTYIEHERNFSVHTVRCYTADLAQFAEFLCNGAPEDGLDEREVSERIRKVALLDLRRYLAELKRADYSRATVARKLATLRSFYKFLARSGEVSRNPVKLIRTPR